MQPLGILILTSGVWLLYSGITGIPPLETLQKIIVNPAKASEIIATAKAESDKLGAVISDVRTAVMISNPFANLKVNNDFQAHKNWGSGAPGVDFAAPVGMPILSPVSGIASENPAGGNGGYIVEVKDSAGYRHQFMHLSKFAGVSGKPVKAGQVIGYSGGKKGAIGAGNSTGPHLHYNIISPSGTFIDPLAYLNRRSDNKAVAQ